MASSAAVAREVEIKARVFQGEGSTTRVFLNPTSATLLAIAGEELLFPFGCRELEIQPRLCRDHYAEIRGDKFYVSGVGLLPLDAVKGALAQVPA